MKNIPGSVAAVSDDWLVGILEEQGRYERGSIQSIDRQPMGERIGQTGEFGRVSVTTETGNKETLFLKLRAPVEGMHHVALRYKMYENEVRFYKELASNLEVRTPEMIYADYDSHNENVAFLMGFMEGWHSPDQISGASHEQACLAVKEITKISAPYWNKTDELPRLPTMKADHLWATISDVKACEEPF